MFVILGTLLSLDLSSGIQRHFQFFYVYCFVFYPCVYSTKTNIDKTEGEKRVDACPLKLVDATILAKK